MPRAASPRLGRMTQALSTAVQITATRPMRANAACTGGANLTCCRSWVMVIGDLLPATGTLGPREAADVDLVCPSTCGRHALQDAEVAGGVERRARQHAVLAARPPRGDDGLPAR